MKIQKYENVVPILDMRLFDGKYNNLPADYFMCEENTLHLGVSDMVTSLILNDLEKKWDKNDKNATVANWLVIVAHGPT